MQGSREAYRTGPLAEYARRYSHEHTRRLSPSNDTHRIVTEARRSHGHREGALGSIASALPLSGGRWRACVTALALNAPTARAHPARPHHGSRTHGKGEKCRVDGSSSGRELPSLSVRLSLLPCPGAASWPGEWSEARARCAWLRRFAHTPSGPCGVAVSSIGMPCESSGAGQGDASWPPACAQTARWRRWP